MPRASIAACSLPKSAKAQRMIICGSPLSFVPSPISSRPWSIRSSSSASRSLPASASGARRNTPMRLNWNATLPSVPMLPP